MQYFEVLETPQNPTLNELIKKANGFIKSKDYDKATQILNTMPTLYPDEPISIYAQAMVDSEGYTLFDDCPLNPEKYSKFRLAKERFETLLEARAATMPEFKEYDEALKKCMDTVSEFAINLACGTLAELLSKIPELVNDDPDEAVRAFDDLVPSGNQQQVDFFYKILPRDNIFFRVFFDFHRQNRMERIKIDAEDEADKMVADFKRDGRKQADIQLANLPYSDSNYINKAREELYKKVDDMAEEMKAKSEALHFTHNDYHYSDGELPESTSEAMDKLYVAMYEYCDLTLLSDEVFMVHCQNPKLRKEGKELAEELRIAEEKSEAERKAKEEAERLKEEAERQKEEAERLKEEKRQKELEARTKKFRIINFILLPVSIIISYISLGISANNDSSIWLALLSLAAAIVNIVLYNKTKPVKFIKVLIIISIVICAVFLMAVCKGV